ncbi:PHA/PHB synthase family protein [Acidisoma sp. 7E03]
MPDGFLPRPPMAPASHADHDPLDRLLHAWQRHFTGGAAPTSLPTAWADWAIHAASHPFRMAERRRAGFDQWLRLIRILIGAEPPVSPPPNDHRFAHPAWGEAPYAALVQAVLLNEAWWQQLIAAPPGVAQHNRALLAFQVQQWLDMISPSNLPWLNPEILSATWSSQGANLRAGFVNFLREQSGADTGPDFRLGRDLAATPGRVILRNDLFELIQYAPTTPTVSAEPVLIVPAWIMKYYILDLSPENSLVRWLVAQGRTVFMMSWRNPDARMRDVAFDDYRAEGVMAALNRVSEICGGQKIHLAGYCLGGTLAAITAAACAVTGDARFASLTLFAAQTDFSEAGELQLFISEDQLAFLDDVMQTEGYLSSRQMSSAFQMLRPNELIWSRLIRDYYLGEAPARFDLMAWNADGTHLPARMHAEYLRSLYLQNDLSEGRFKVAGRTIALEDIRLPLFVVGTENDHIAPWRSVYKLHFLNDGAITFVLTSGGHNAGIVSEPGHPNRHFRVATRPAGGHTLGPEDWQAAQAPREGSWWLEWNAFLAAHSGADVSPPALAKPDLGAAPGRYVFEKA